MAFAEAWRMSRMSSDAKERTVPVNSEPSLDRLFDGFLRQAATRNGGSAPKLRDWVKQAEAWRISHALRECRGNRSAAARISPARVEVDSGIVSDS